MSKSKNPSTKSKDLPASIGIVHAVRDELKARFSELDFKMESQFKGVAGQFKGIDARFKEIDARFKEIDARFDKVDARFDKVDARFNKVDARFDHLESLYYDMRSSIHRMEIMLEEQRAENKVVFENYGIFSNRMDRIEKRQDDHDLILTRFAKSKKHS